MKLFHRICHCFRTEVSRWRRLGLLPNSLRWLPTSYVESLVRRLIVARMEDLPVAEGLRFLFRVDAALYTLEGGKAVEYDGGLHTKHRHMRYHDFFVSNIATGERVLDVGCGVGALALSIANGTGAWVTAIDLDVEKIQRAIRDRPHPRIQYQVRDVTDDLGARRYDVAVLSNVLEHLPRRPETLKRIRESAAPARYLLRVPSFDRDWRVPLRRELGVEWRLDPTHETEYTLESFHQELSEAGLCIRKHEVRWGEIWAEAVPSES